jgi:repressor of nif and glnA expression
MANNMVKFQENMKKLRENPDTSRAGLKWDDSEDENVLSKLKGGMSVDDIAKNLKRTANSIKTRIIMNAVAQIEEDSKNKAKVMKELKVTEADITEYKEKKQQRDDQQKNFINSMISKNIYNPTIRDNYQLLKEILNRLTAIEDKLNKE